MVPAHQQAAAGGQQILDLGCGHLGSLRIAADFDRRIGRPVDDGRSRYLAVDKPGVAGFGRIRSKQRARRSWQAMAAVLVTGMSGTGKSTLLAELAQRGHRVVDTDHDGWIIDVPQPDGGTEPMWDEARMTELLSSRAPGGLAVRRRMRGQPGPLLPAVPGGGAAQCPARHPARTDRRSGRQRVRQEPRRASEDHRRRRDVRAADPRGRDPRDRHQAARWPPSPTRSNASPPPDPHHESPVPHVAWGTG